ncbi:MAG: hypothetical protein GC203_05910 [Phenylobacterium sp.]|uniref:hypothetical protein n=1 Tax=Phenylobacterium sp. TaxID=1871053 RepID=UPI0025F1B446|nr:hypothetical protein [Phenylobacterium sp.]MBI1197379.1 hypothetical protein [Phenylobacterium sp.]
MATSMGEHGEVALVATTLEVLAAEIELAAAHSITMDRIVGEVMDQLPEAERNRLTHSLHGVDLLAQHLTSLATFARNLSREVPGESKATVRSALSEITLGALAERMAAGLGGPAPVLAAQAVSGDVDLF